MFCHITTNWRGRPLVSYQVVVSLIAHTTTRSGLKVHAQLDRHHYPTGVKVTLVFGHYDWHSPLPEAGCLIMLGCC
jgi:hypothetical protein